MLVAAVAVLDDQEMRFASSQTWNAGRVERNRKGGRYCCPSRHGSDAGGPRIGQAIAERC
jgi:hypothetical protein